MRNYIILNGNNSNNITGLLIQSLAPITKPAIRTMIEEIDGRDGDIITPLGYGAYDKEISIGLYGNYNVDDVIAFFNDNKSGKATFSNEDDKYYNYEIYEQIDFDRLIRFKTASVKMHVQPFKYPTEEEAIEIEAEAVTGTGEAITLNDVAEDRILLNLKGNTSQETTTGKNLVPTNSFTLVKGTNRTIQINFPTPIPAGTYTLSCKIINQSGLTTSTGLGIQFNNGGTNIGTIGTIVSNTTSPYINSKTISQQATHLYCYLDNSLDDTATITIDELMIETGSTATSYEPYTNGASPNPDYPQPVQVVTGENVIKIYGKNLIDTTAYNKAINGTTGAIQTPGTSSNYLSFDDYVDVKPNTTYTISFEDDDSSAGLYLGSKDINGDFIERVNLGSIRTFTTGANVYQIFIYLYKSNGNFQAGGWVQLEYGNQATTYTQYQEQNYTIDLDTLELCKIGTYQDYLYKSGENWYKHTEIGKITLDGTEDITQNSNTSYSNTILRFTISVPDKKLSASNTEADNIKCNMFTPKALNYDARTQESITGHDSNHTIIIFIDSSRLSSADTTGFKAWLSSNTPVVYYVLATPTEELITDETLIDQLDDIYDTIHSYDTQTNITQTNDNKPFIMEAKAVLSGSNEGIVENVGNFYSKPVIEIEGIGSVEAYLNNIHVFTIDLSETNTITIDTANLEAYNPDTKALMNRKVTGSYENFKLAVGENTLKFTGSFVKAEITKYVRWL